MNIFSLAGVLLSILCLGLAVFISSRAKNVIQRIWAVFNIILCFWGIVIFFIGVERNSQVVYLFWKAFLILLAFIFITFYHLVYAYCKNQNKAFLIFAYFQGIIFSLLIVGTNVFGNSVTFLFHQFYYLKPNITFSIFFIIWCFILFKALGGLWRFIKSSSDTKRLQAKYLFYSSVIGFLGGATTALPGYGIHIYPIGHILVGVYAIICTYAIFRHHLMDIGLAVSNTAIFIGVYALVLGVPLVFGYKFHRWEISTWTMLVLATGGPLILRELQRRMEGLIQKEEKTILEIFRKALREIPHIKDLQHLFQFVTLNLQKLSIDYIVYFIWDIDSKSFVLRESVPPKSFHLTFADNDPLIFQLKNNNGKSWPLTYDQVQFEAKDNKKPEFQKLIPKMEELSAQVVIPMMSEGLLVGFIVLGERADRRMYSEELLDLLSSIGTLAGNAVANYFYWGTRGMKEKQLSLDHMADSMAHEIDNPVMAIQMQSGVIERYLKDARVFIPEEVRTKFDRSMAHIYEACGRISGQIAKIKAHAKGTNLPKTPLKLSEVEENYWKMMEHVFNRENTDQEIEYKKEIEPDLPYVLGNQYELVQILENFLRNSLHAVRSSKIKKIQLKVYCKNNDWIRIEFSDTGYGIKADIIQDIWLSHMTTKGSVEGSGMGLFIIRKNIEGHGGRTWAESEGEGKGATMIVELPVFKGNLNDYVVKEETQNGPKTLI